MRVKICGLTSRDDAVAAIECGADALGFNLWPGSRRYVPLAKLRNIAVSLPNPVERVAVLVDPTLEEAAAVARSGCVESLQLHGNESPKFCLDLRKLGVRFSKAMTIASATTAIDPVDYSSDSIVLDTASAAGFGGTGETFPWDWAKRFIATHAGRRVWLAGGLTPANVTEAIRVVRPYGVDVTTGVERIVREKDRVRMKAFIDAARAA